MKIFLTIGFLSLAIFISNCSNGQTQNSTTNLSAMEFAAKIKELPAAPLVDVRTPEEFSKGHLHNAKNLDWKGNAFDRQIASLDKAKPVFVYCLSGGRSAAAATKMRSEGFKEVYELTGGILKWKSANLPEITQNATASTGITLQQFNGLISSNKLVLIDFNADWCAPCKIMKPYLDEISKDMADKVVVISINVDNNLELCRELKIDALPVLQLYKNKALNWQNTGYIEKAEVLKHITASAE